MPLRTLHLLRSFATIAVCLLIALAGPVRAATTAKSGELTFKHATTHGVDLAASRDCEQIKIVPLPKLLKANGVEPESTRLTSRHPCTIESPQATLRAPLLRKSTWVGIIVLRI